MTLWQPLEGAFKSFHRPVRAADLSADGQFALCSGDSLDVWDMQRGKSCLTLDPSDSELLSVCLFNRLRFAVTAARGGRVQVWDLDSGECVEELEAHHGGLRSFRGDLDGRFFLSFGDDRALRLWEVEWELAVGQKEKTLRDTLGKSGLFQKNHLLFQTALVG